MIQKELKDLAWLSLLIFSVEVTAKTLGRVPHALSFLDDRVSPSGPVWHTFCYWDTFLWGYWNLIPGLHTWEAQTPLLRLLFVGMREFGVPLCGRHVSMRFTT